MKNRAEFKTRKALFIDERRITDFEWDEGEIFENVAVMLRESKKVEYMQGKYKQYYDVAGFDTLTGKRLFLFKNTENPIIIAENSIFISKMKGESTSKAVYSLNGNCIIPFDKYDNILPLEFSTPLVAFLITTKDGKCGVWNVETGEETVPTICENMVQFSDAIILEAKIDNKMQKGLFYGNGNFTGFVYDDIHEDHEYHYLCKRFGNGIECINTLINTVERM